MSISLKNKLNKTKIVHSQKITYFNLNCKIQSQVGIRDRLKVREQVCEKLFIDGQRHPVNQVLATVIGDFKPLDSVPISVKFLFLNNQIF